MNKQELQEKIFRLTSDSAATGLELYFVFKKENNFELVEPDLESKKLEPILKNNFTVELQSKILSENEDRSFQLQSLNSPEASDERVLWHIPARDLPSANQLFKSASSKKTLSHYDKAKYPFTEVWGLIIKIATDQDAVYLFKKSYPINVLKPNTIYPLFFRGNTLQLEEKELLKVSKHIDAFFIDGDLIVLEKDVFERSFDYVEAMQKNANASIDLLIDAQIIDDGSKIYDLSNQRSQLKRIIAIKSDNPALQKSAKQIVKFAKKYNLELTLSEDKSRIELTNKKHAKALLKIFNDDYLISELTNRQYDSKGKSRI